MIEGFYTKHKIRMPFYKEPCISCDSGDSDLAGPVAAIRYQVKRPVAVFNPHEGACDELKRYASLYKNVPRDLPAKCQLPDAIPVGTHGNFIRRPAAWK